MNRRAFVTGLGAVLAAPIAAAAQRKPRPRLGYISNSSGESDPDQAFMDALRGLGYVRGTDLEIVDRYSAGHLDRLPAMVSDVLRQNVDVILAWGAPAAVAAKKLTTTIPIVFVGVVDPMSVGLVSSLGRPGGNATGVSFSEADAGPKRLSLLKEALPAARRIAVLVDSAVPGWEEFVNQTRVAAAALKIELDVESVRDAGELGSAFIHMGQRRANAVSILISPMFWAHRADLANLAQMHRLPSIYGVGDYAALGGLMGYGADLRAMARTAAIYIDRLLKGAKAGDLPVQIPTKFELQINLKTAKALGVTIPPSLLLRADQVIE
jgi:putative tryptophan/tyrosine transport system substrate-binding protein